ncbi:NUDT1 [Scenedesmus sp. PABB004]|nr:NUDT1 [Scenedesmus sp. PABB004]
MAGAPAFVGGVLARAAGARKLLTLAIVHERGGRVLLGRKKRGFGAGLLNGFGGKVEPGETVAAAAARELAEEAGVAATRLDLRGVLTFVWDDNPEPWEVHVFHAPGVVGEPVETEEMCPVWTDAARINFDAMWEDDRHWYPLFLAGKSFHGLFAFTNTSTLVWHALREVESPGGAPSADELLRRSGGAAAWGSGGGAAAMVLTRSGRRSASAGAAGGAAAAAASVELDAVKNFRDLADAYSPMRPGAVFRTAAPVSATPGDLRLLFADLGIKDLIDLRSSEEVAAEGGSHVFDGISFCRCRRDPATGRVVPDATTYVHGAEREGVLRVQIAVMEKHRYYWSILSRMGKRRALKLVATSLLDKPASRRMAIAEVNAGGLAGLYRTLLEDSPQEFAAALRHILASAEARRPVLFFCKAGKDRTGLVAALLLSVLGASEEQVLADYVLSDRWHMVALAGLEDNPKVSGLDRAAFERAPREAMHAALQMLRDEHGGVPAYLAAAGFGPDAQQALRDALLRQQPGSGGGGGAPAAAPGGASGRRPRLPGSHIALISTRGTAQAGPTSAQRAPRRASSTAAPASGAAMDAGGAPPREVVYENTYITGPAGYGEGAKFARHRVQAVLKAVLKERMDKQQYDPVKAAQTTKHLAEDLREKVKALGYERYKLVVQVTLGQKKGQAMRIVSRCLWDTATDSFVSEYYENDSLYCVCQVFGLYYDPHPRTGAGGAAAAPHLSRRPGQHATPGGARGRRWRSMSDDFGEFDEAPAAPPAAVPAAAAQAAAAAAAAPEAAAAAPDAAHPAAPALTAAGAAGAGGDDDDDDDDDDGFGDFDAVPAAAPPPPPAPAAPPAPAPAAPPEDPDLLALAPAPFLDAQRHVPAVACAADLEWHGSASEARLITTLGLTHAVERAAAALAQAAGGGGAR